MGVGADSRAASFVELAIEGGAGPRFGVGVDTNIVTSSILAVFSAVNRGLAGLDAAQRNRLLAHLEALDRARRGPRKAIA